jgi:hypothetical protein
MAIDKKILADSTAAAKEAAAMIGGTFEQGVGFTPGTPQKETPGMDSGTTSAMSKALEERLLGAVDGISSSSSAIDSTISNAIEAQKQSQVAGASRIETDYAYEKDFLQGKSQAKINTAQESRRGFATQFAALRNLTDSTAKDLRDLEGRRQDALLANDSTAAENIAKLQMEKLDYEQKAKQAYFDNLLGLADYSAKRSDEAFNRNMSIKEYDLAITKDAREASYDEWKKTYETQKFEFEKATTLAEQQMNQVRTNIMLRELKLKEAEQGSLAPDPGFATVSIQNSIGAAANTKLTQIQAQIASGAIKENSPEHEAATVKAYMELRREASTSQAADDAIARTLGLTISDSKELGMISAANPDTQLPGDSSDLNVGSFVDWFSSTVLGEKTNVTESINDKKRLNSLLEKTRSGKYLSPAEYTELTKLQSQN